jgi:hypothetical protein
LMLLVKLATRRLKMKKTNKHDTYYYCDKAEQSGLRVKFDYSNHPIIDAPDGSSLMLPSSLKSSHTECIIRKWLIRFGVVLILVFTLAYLF